MPQAADFIHLVADVVHRLRAFPALDDGGGGVETFLTSQRDGLAAEHQSRLGFGPQIHDLLEQGRVLPRQLGQALELRRQFRFAAFQRLEIRLVTGDGKPALSRLDIEQQFQDPVHGVPQSHGFGRSRQPLRELHPGDAGKNHTAHR